MGGCAFPVKKPRLLTERKKDRAAEAARKVCPAGSEFPRGTSFYLFRILVTGRNAKSEKLFACGEKDGGL
jgi:hypothetical protein